MLVVITYDVSTIKPEGQRRLRKVAKVCKDYGQRVQFSVFECVVDPARWARVRQKLIDEIDGTFEYTGNEPFSGQITIDFTSESSGGAQDFRYKMVHDIGAGFVNLPDDVIARSSIGNTSKSVSKTFPLAAVKGDQIKPQITRNSGSSSIVTSEASFYVTQ